MSGCQSDSESPWKNSHLKYITIQSSEGTNCHGRIENGKNNSQYPSASDPFKSQNIRKSLAAPLPSLPRGGEEESFCACFMLFSEPLLHL